MIAFVILHYQTIEHTTECIKSIRDTIGDNDYHIIVVDNASPNNSGMELLNKYEEDKDVSVILNEKNLGFSNGNNVGFKCAKYEYHADFIVMLNADTRILISDFGTKVFDAFDKFFPGIIGPLILSGDSKYTSNPMRYNALTIEKVDEFLIDYKIRLWCLKNGLLGNIVGSAYSFVFKARSKMKRFFDEPHKGFSSTDYIRYQLNYTLHGSFMIFTPLYIDKFDGLDEATFMYCEEDLLYQRCQKSGIDILYDPKIIIYHYEGGSTEVNRNSKAKRIFFFENSIKSLRILRNRMEEMK